MAMGNLHAGSSAIQLIRLVNTWFLGINEPVADKTYRAVRGSLFGVGGAVYTDVQGAVGDCWLVAGLAAVAAREPSLLTSMFTYDGTNVVNDEKRSMFTPCTSIATVRPTISRWIRSCRRAAGTMIMPATALWASLAEKAFAQANGAGWVTTWNNNNTNGYSALDGGFPSWALSALTGRTSAAGGVSGAVELVGVDPNAMANAFQAGQSVALCHSALYFPDSSLIVSQHCYAMVGYDPNSATPFTLYNPFSYSTVFTSYDGHQVFGQAFHTDAAFINGNFRYESIAGTAPGSFLASDRACRRHLFQ